VCWSGAISASTLSGALWADPVEAPLAETPHVVAAVLLQDDRGSGGPLIVDVDGHDRASLFKGVVEPVEDPHFVTEGHGDLLHHRRQPIFILCGEVGPSLLAMKKLGGKLPLGKRGDGFPASFGVVDDGHNCPGQVMHGQAPTPCHLGPNRKGLSSTDEERDLDLFLGEAAVVGAEPLVEPGRQEHLALRSQEEGIA